MVRYYKYETNGWTRISIVEVEDESGFDSFRHGQQIDASELPADFPNWKTYERFALDNAVVNVVSPGGE